MGSGSTICFEPLKSCSGSRASAVVIAAVFLLFNIAAFGQTNATIRGQITDQSGAVLPGVSISMKNQDTGVERAVLSDEIGNYQVAALPVGRYQIEARLQGMKPEIISGLVLEVNQTMVRN